MTVYRLMELTHRTDCKGSFERLLVSDIAAPTLFPRPAVISLKSWACQLLVGLNEQELKYLVIYHLNTYEYSWKASAEAQRVCHLVVFLIFVYTSSHHLQRISQQCI